jgi:hypothetical protein
VPDLVRVRDAATGHWITITAAQAAADTKRYRVLSRPAVDASGRPLPPKFATPKVTRRTPASGEAATATHPKANKEATES